MGEILIREGIHYEADDFKDEYTCLSCHRKFPYAYQVQNPRGRTRRGVKQLMRLHASNNFRKHLKACWNKPGDAATPTT